MKVIVGCPVKNRAWVLPEWWDAIDACDVEVELMCLLSKSDDTTEEFLRDHKITILYDDRPGRKPQEIIGHLWGKPDTYEYMAGLRNRLVTAALDREADFFFSLDSDIILPPHGLEDVLNWALRNPGITAPAVNMTRGGTAWNTMSWKDPYHPGDALRPLKHPSGGQVDVVMAAVMMDRLGMTCYWAEHPQGEDVGLSLDAWNRQVPLWWLPQIICQHRMVYEP